MPSLGGLQEYLNAAVQLKTALVKSRPGRQEWEQAPPFLRSTAAATPEVQRAREQGDFNEQYRLALQLKEQGNELVNKAPEEALEKYSQALSVFLWFDRGTKKDAEDVPLVCAAEKLQGTEQEQAHHVLALAFCNAAACLLALGMTADAAYACSKALKYDPYNVKALYRRALAHRRTDTRAGLEAAVTDLAAANTLEPANNQVRMALTSLQHELRELRRKERGLYGNMFERGELYDGTAAGGGASSSAGAAAGPSAGGAEASSASARAELPAPGTKPAKQQEQGGRGGRGDGDGQGEDDEDGWLDEDRDEHDWGPGASGRDSEDQLLLDQRRRKAKATAASREADVVMRRMQRSLAAARNRKMAERLNVERARQGGAGPFPWYLVPWWAYVLILLHLTYRVIKGTMELADMDEPGNNWYFGDEQAEIFEYKLLGEVPAQSGFTSFLYRDTLERIRGGEAQGLPSWAQFTELTSDTVKWPTRKTPFLFAGRIVEASAAALYVLEREGQVKGVLVSSESSGGLAGSEND